MSFREPNFRSASYFIAQRSVKCRSCGASTRVSAVVLPADHEVLEDDEDGQDPGWQSVGAVALLFYIGELPTTAQAHLQRLAPGFRLAHEMPEDPHWNNHCEHCGTSCDEEDLHSEPGDTFVPISEGQAAKIRLIEIREPFAAWAAGYSLDTQFLALTPSA